MAQLPKQEQTKYREALLEQVLGARSEDGSYLDNPLNGSLYATGMALLAFQYMSIPNPF